MWYEETADIRDYFSSIEEGEIIPDEEILGESYHVMPQTTFDEILSESEDEGIDTYGLDTTDQDGSAYFRALDGESLIVVDHQRDPLKVKATTKHEETHIATGNPADTYNIEGVAYARENFFRKQNGMKQAELEGRPILTMVINQWTPSYVETAEELGDLEALQTAANTLKQCEPSKFELLKTPLKNPYVEEFEERVSELV